MPISTAEMQRISKEKTSEELQKLHKSILQNNDLLKSTSEWRDSDFTESDESESDEEPKIKRLTLSELFKINQHLQKELRQMCAKVEKVKNNHTLIETKYEQMRIENSEQYLRICELATQNSNQKRFIFASVTTLIGVLVRCIL